MILYTKNNCEYCDKAKAYLNKLEGFSFEVRNVEENKEHLLEFLQLTKKLGTDRQVPLFTNGNRSVQGFDAKEYLGIVTELSTDQFDGYEIVD